MGHGLVDGQVILVTGGGSGIGRATALLLAQEGARGVVVADVSEDAANQTVELMAGLGAEVVTHIGDLSEPAVAGEIVGTAMDRFGRLDSAVNCAGMAGAVLPIDEYGDERWARLMSVNLDAVFRCVTAQIRVMVPAGGGSIVNVASTAAVDPVPGLAAYSASKRAVTGFTRAVAGEYVKRGVRVNVVLPGPTATPMVLSELAGTNQGAERGATLPMGRMGAPREVAEGIVWLSSSRASYVTGAELVIDGGTHAFAPSAL